MRVLLIVGSAHSGGAEIYIARAVKALEQEGTRVSLTGFIGPMNDSVKISPLRLGPKWGLRTLPVGLMRLCGEISRVHHVVRGEAPALVWLHFKREQVGFTRVVSRLRPVVWTEHGEFPRGLFGALISLPYWLAARRVEAVVCVSDRAAQSVRRHVPKSTRVLVIETGVDTTLRRPASRSGQARAREALGLPRDGLVAVFVGRLTATKRPGLAIDAALLAGGSIIVLGDGPAMEDLSRRFCDDPRVLLFGQVDDTRTAYSAADVHLFTSDGTGEGLPTVILEASAHGVPTVGCVDGGFVRLIEQAGGRCGQPNPRGLVDAMSQVLVDEGHGAAARAWAEVHSLSAWAAAYDSVFHDALAQAGITDGE